MKCLIAYSTKYGSAAEIAKRIQNKLEGECTIVNIKTDKVPPLDAYDTVVLGASVYIGKIQKEMAAFAASHKDELLTKALGLFLSAGAQKEADCETELKAAFPAELLEKAAAKDILGFAYHFEKMGFVDRFILKKVKGNDKDEEVYYDDKIEQFVAALNCCAGQSANIK